MLNQKKCGVMWSLQYLIFGQHLIRSKCWCFIPNYVPFCPVDIPIIPPLWIISNYVQLCTSAIFPPFDMPPFNIPPGPCPYTYYTVYIHFICLHYTHFFILYIIPPLFINLRWWYHCAMAAMVPAPCWLYPGTPRLLPIHVVVQLSSCRTARQR